jgi:hypothetical protein
MCCILPFSSPRILVDESPIHKPAKHAGDEGLVGQTISDGSLLKLNQIILRDTNIDPLSLRSAFFAYSLIFIRSLSACCQDMSKRA